MYFSLDVTFHAAIFTENSEKTPSKPILSKTQTIHGSNVSSSDY